MTEIKYQEIDLDDVMNFFIKSFEIPEGHILSDHAWFLDVAKQKVVFKLYITEDGGEDG